MMCTLNVLTPLKAEDQREIIDTMNALKRKTNRVRIRHIIFGYDEISKHCAVKAKEIMNTRKEDNYVIEIINQDKKYLRGIKCDVRHSWQW